MTSADIPDEPMAVPTAGQLRRMSAGDIATLTRNTDNPDVLFLLSLLQIENSRFGR